MKRGLFSLVIAVLVLKESRACFDHSDDYPGIYVKTGTPYYVECTCNALGYDIRNIKWLGINDTVVVEQRPGIEQSVYTEKQSNSVSLHIPYMSKKVSGIYKCQTNYEGTVYNQTYHVTAYDPITINPPVNQFILLGNRSLIRCEVHSEPGSDHIVSWHKDLGDRLVKIVSNEKYFIAPEGLYINNVGEGDKGTYSCTVLERETFDEVDTNIHVEIITMPVIERVRAIPEPTVIVNDRLVIECVAEGTPHPEYVWKKKDQPSKEKSRWEQHNNAIVINNVQPEDHGTYECIAQSNAGVVSKTIDIQVLVPPNITQFQNITAKEGSTVQIVCNAEGRPAPKITIIFVDKDPDLNELYDNDIIQNLEFIKVDRTHMGVYACNASNDVDYDTQFMYLSVEFRPHFESVAEVVWGWPGHAVNLSCEHESNPPAVLTWRYQGNEITTSEQVEVNNLLDPVNINGSTFINVNVSVDPFPFGVYECKAINPLGESMKIITFKEGFVPDVIKNATELTIGQTSVTFNLEGPDTVEGPTIHGYTAEYDKESNANVTYIHMNRTWAVDRPYTIENLEPNTTYFIRFAALNEVGKGPWSWLMEFTTLEPSVPSPPQWQAMTDGELVNITTMDQLIAWNPSEANGAPVDYYVVRYCQMDVEEACMEERIEANSEMKLDNRLLEYNITYSIELIAHNYMGDSVPANLTVLMLVETITAAPLLSAGAIIGISVVIVFICLLLLDLLLLLWRRQGIIASCCIKKKKASKAEESLRTRDKKGLLKDNREVETSPDNRHKEFEYNKTTGIITGRHSAV
ncbi:hypothetical protein ABMA27_003923 [Loxostege sticticalis]|uniref:Fasciclin-2-like n=2 Tax=Loxostege sticticalis TaxID=481309 RepID=A0ABR3HQV9_LOXSC